jgi:high-affinity iron transporter
MILNGGILAFLFLAVPPASTQQDPSQDPVGTARRVAATTQLAAQEYRLGVVGGKIVARAEVDEAGLFLQEARRSAAALPPEAKTPAVVAIDSLIHLVRRVGDPDSVSSIARALASDLSRRLGVSLDELPATTPSLARGGQVYQRECAGCHGATGRGDGQAGTGLDPKPADLADWQALHDQSPLDYFRRISIGVVGTAMPAFEHRLPAEDRWAVALYASVLRLPPPSGETPPALGTFATTGKMSDDELLRALGRSGDRTALGLVSGVRSAEVSADASNFDQVFDRVRAEVESTYALARTGDSSAGTRAFDAYMTFEQVETSVRAKNPGLAAELEADFAALRTHAAGGASPGQLAAVRQRLASGLEKAERTLGDRLSPANLFLQSFVIMLREGLEAILIVGALMTFLVKMGAGNRRRDVNLGVGAAIVASLLTAIALETVFQISPAKREALEGVTMVVAAVVLFYVSYWLLSKMEVAKWNRFVKTKVQDALTSGSALALASAAFLAVYREGFETVLFYKALFLTSGPGGSPVVPVAGGIVVGSFILVAVYIAIHRFGVRLPLKPFFGVTSAFLYYMAFVFAGAGIAELQEGGTVPMTPVPWAPRIPALGIHPTVETLAAQLVLVVLAAVALVWTFVIEPRRALAAERRRSGEAVA